MDSSDLRASVVIPTYFRRSSLARVLTPVLEDPGTAEVIVVIDGSSDGSLEFLRSWAESEPRIRPVFQENGGENSSRLRGVREARFDVTVILDDDVEAGPGLISSHVLSHRGHPRRLVLGYMPVRISRPRRWGQVTTLLYGEDYENACALFESDPKEVFTHFWAGNFSLRRDVAEEMLTFPETRLGYHGDLQFGLRCREADLEPVFDRALAATHHHHRTLREFGAEARRSGAGRAQLGREHPELAEELDPVASLSPRASLIVRYLGHPSIRDLSTPVVTGLSELSGRLHLWRLQTATAQMLRVIELARGFHESPRL